MSSTISIIMAGMSTVLSIATLTGMGVTYFKNVKPAIEQAKLNYAQQNFVFEVYKKEAIDALDEAREELDFEDIDNKEKIFENLNNRDKCLANYVLDNGYYDMNLFKEKLINDMREEIENEVIEGGKIHLADMDNSEKLYKAFEDAKIENKVGNKTVKESKYDDKDKEDLRYIVDNGLLDLNKIKEKLIKQISDKIDEARVSLGTENENDIKEICKKIKDYNKCDIKYVLKEKYGIDEIDGTDSEDD